MQNSLLRKVYCEVTCFWMLCPYAGPFGVTSGSSGLGTPRNIGFQALAERMEIISPQDIQLVRFLGAGGYGEVRPVFLAC